MIIRKLTISNFRCFKSPTPICFGEHNLIIGPNGVGKTAILYAIRFLLGRERMYRDLEEYDWPDKKILDDDGDPIEIRISAILSDLSEADEDVLGPANQGTALRKYDLPNQQLTNEDYGGDYANAGIEVAFAARFDLTTGEFDYRRYFKQSDDSPFDTQITPLTDDHLRHIGLFFVPGMRTWEQAISFSSSSFVKLMKEENAMPGAFTLKVVEALEKATPTISDAPRLSQTLSDIKDHINKLIPTDNLSFSTTRLTMADVEKQQWLFSSHGTSRLPVALEGSGFVSLLNLFLIYRFVEHRVAPGNNKNVILVLEEPELHLYPHVQRQIITLIRSLDIQSITTSHSPQLASVYSVDEYIPLQKRAIGISVVPGLKTLESSHKKAYRKLAFTKRNEFVQALMGSTMVLVEGISDENILSRLATVKTPTLQTSQGLTFLAIDSMNPQEFGQAIYDKVENLVFLVDGDGAGDVKAEKIRTASFISNIPVLLIQWDRNHALERVLEDDLGAESANALTEINACATIKKADTDFVSILHDNDGNTEVHECLISFILEKNITMPRMESVYQKITDWLDSRPGVGLTEVKV